MAKKWAEVAASPEFQALGPDEQEAARSQYFDSVVAPQVGPDEVQHARTQFDQMYGSNAGAGASGVTPAGSTPVAASAAAPAPAPSLRQRVQDSVLNWYGNSPAMGALDVAAEGVSQVGSKILSGLGGGLKLATGQGLDAAAETARNGIPAYEAQTPSGKDLKEMLGLSAAPFQAAAAPIERGLDKVNPEIVPTLAKGTEAATDIASILGVGGALGAASKASQIGSTASRVEGAARMNGRGSEAARAAGYEARPSDFKAANPEQDVPGMTRESMAGSHEKQKDFTFRNQIRTNDLAAEDMGLKKGTKITPEALAKAETPHVATYEETGAKAGTFATPGDLRTKLLDAAENTDLPAKYRKDLANFSQNIDGPAAIKAISELRSKARMALNSNELKTEAAGHDLLDLANGMEDAIGSRMESLGETAQLSKFRAARTSLAKINDYGAALKNGHIDAQLMKRLDEKNPGRMTGNAAVIANAGSSLPNVTGLSTKATGTGSVGVPTSKTGVIGAVANKAADLGMKLTGTSLDSPKFQNQFGREATPTEATYKPDRAPQFSPARQSLVEQPDLGLGEALMLQAPAGAAPSRIVQPQIANQNDLGLGEALTLTPPEGVAPRITRPAVQGPLGQQLGMDLGLTPQVELAPSPGSFGVPPSELPLATQLGLGVDTPQPVIMPLEPPPGRVGKVKPVGKGKDSDTRDNRKKRKP